MLCACVRVFVGGVLHGSCMGGEVATARQKQTVVQQTTAERVPRKFNQLGSLLCAWDWGCWLALGLWRCNEQASHFVFTAYQTDSRLDVFARPFAILYLASVNPELDATHNACLPSPDLQRVTNPRRYASVWDEWLEQVEGFAARVPLLFNLGNHEYDVPRASWPLGRTHDRYDRPDSGGECGVPASMLLAGPGMSATGEAAMWCARMHHVCSSFSLSWHGE